MSKKGADIEVGEGYVDQDEAASNDDNHSESADETTIEISLCGNLF